MSRRLSKDESRARWRELRKLWNEYDPIGVVDPAEIEVCREYESYVGDVLRFLEKETPSQTIVMYLRQVGYGSHRAPVVIGTGGANGDICCTMSRLVPEQSGRMRTYDPWLNSITEAK